MKSFIYLTFLLSLLQYGHPLVCYKCNGCESTPATEETCRLHDAEWEVSICVTQEVLGGGANGGPIIIKKCDTREKNKAYQCRDLPDGDTRMCDTCVKDYCNAASPLATNNHYVYVGVVFLFFLPKLLVS